MKAAFNIPPKKEEISQLHLLIEAGSYGIFLLWFTRAPFTVKGLEAYNISNGDHVPDIQNIFESREQYLTGLLSVTICYDFKESLLVPEKYHVSTNNEGALSLVYGEDRNAFLQSEMIKGGNMYNIYRIQKDIENIFLKQFPIATIFHSTSLQVQQVNTKKEGLYCIIFHNVLKVILYKEEKLQFVQQFNYNIPDDVAYHLLNVCGQYDVQPSEVQLKLSGMIDGNSKLYNELYKYFMHIGFEDIPENVAVTEEIKALPAHFFSHLTMLALCVS